MSRLVPTLPPEAPRSGGNAFSRWVGRAVLRLGGWKVVGEWPRATHLVMIVAPHSSAWDVVWGLAAKVACGVDVVFMGKQEAFWGPIGWVLKRFGGMPVNRSAPGGVIEQVAAQLRSREKMWFVIAPEGTRRPVERWKSGFWKIAKRAGVPVFCVWFHYPERTLGLGPQVQLSDDLDADLVRIRALFKPHRGLRRGA
jgi:1-acyl-sn-glycerol-3-phosphate acyltransferase